MAGADVVVVVATPVGMIAPMIEKIAPHLKAGCIVTDVGSTKVCLPNRAWKPGAGTFSSAAIPSAGSERDGATRGRSVPLSKRTVRARSSAWPGGGVRASWAREGRRSPADGDGGDEHDAIVATVSHLPHIVAAALVRAAARRRAYATLLQLAAGGFRDTTRVASGLRTCGRTSASPTPSRCRGDRSLRSRAGRIQGGDRLGAIVGSRRSGETPARRGRPSLPSRRGSSGSSMTSSCTW